MKNSIILLALLGLSGCKDQPEQIPAYLTIEPFTVNAQGDASWHKITDAWVYVNGEYLGAYTLPATVPFLVDGPGEVWLYPGVKENGILASPNIYPELTRWESSSVQFNPGETTVVKPDTRYDQAAVFPFGLGRGDFDGGSSIVIENRDDDDATGFSITPDGAFAGKCILMQVDTAHPLITIATEKVSGLPVSGSPEVWLEMHYQCDQPFYLSLLYSSNSGAELAYNIFAFNPSENWNKIYINLTEALSQTAATDYRLYFQVPLPKDATSGKYTQQNGTVRIDNIRLVHL